MIQVPGRSFGYGMRFGVVRGVRDHDAPRANERQGCVLRFESLPSAEFFRRISTSGGVEAFIVPPCSSYSHLAGTIWSRRVPTMAIGDLGRLADGIGVLLDFENGLLHVAESVSEADELEASTRACRSPSGIAPEGQAKPAVGRRSSMSVLAEATSADDLHGALVDGADGVSVVRAEDLLQDIGGKAIEARALAQALTDARQALPILVRFFDPDLELENVSGQRCVAQRYLGYRGVRVLEVDDKWSKAFIAGLDMLGLDGVVVVLPMVTSVSEVRRAMDQFGHHGHRVGVTVETPAAALRISELLGLSTFIQIGLNDLTQYTMAWDRDVANEERLPSDFIVEPVADLIRSVTAACRLAGVPYTVGLDLRPSQALVGQLLGLGVGSISCAPALVKPWRLCISGYESHACAVAPAER